MCRPFHITYLSIINYSCIVSKFMGRYDINRDDGVCKKRGETGWFVCK